MVEVQKCHTTQQYVKCGKAKALYKEIKTTVLIHVLIRRIILYSGNVLTMGKFGKFGELSLLRQTLTNQILAYKWYPYG